MNNSISIYDLSIYQSITNDDKVLRAMLQLLFDAIESNLNHDSDSNHKPAH